MMKIFFTIGLLFLLSALRAQHSKWGISFSPSLVTTTSIKYGVQPGVFYQVNDRVQLLTDLTFMAGHFMDSSSLNTSYVRIKPEIRYMFSKRKSILGLYGGLQVSYSYRKWKNLIGGAYFHESLFEDSAILYRSAVIKSPVMTSSLQLGTLVSISPRFSLDFFMGMGVRIVNTSYSQLQNTSKGYNIRPSCKIMFSPDPAYLVNGTVSRFHMNLGLRGMFRF